MKKLIVCAVLIGATCAFAAEGDSYLYWMIDPEATITDGGQQSALPTGPVGVKISAFAPGSDWSYGGSSADNYLTLVKYSRGKIGDEIGRMADNVEYGSQFFAAVPVDYQGLDWTYYVELYNDGRIFARSDALPYSAESIVALAGMGRPGTLWNVKAFVPAAVPEPSSGLLLLLGVAGLALRRRKQIAA